MKRFKKEFQRKTCSLEEKALEDLISASEEYKFTPKKLYQNPISSWEDSSVSCQTTEHSAKLHIKLPSVNSEKFSKEQIINGLSSRRRTSYKKPRIENFKTKQTEVVRLSKAWIDTPRAPPGPQYKELYSFKLSSRRSSSVSRKTIQLNLNQNTDKTTRENFLEKSYNRNRLSSKIRIGKLIDMHLLGSK